MSKDRKVGGVRYVDVVTGWEECRRGRGRRKKKKEEREERKAWEKRMKIYLYLW